jgi:hypothetical protein
MQCWSGAGALAVSLMACGSEAEVCDEITAGDASAFLSVDGHTIQHSLCEKASELSGEPIDASGLLIELIDPAALGDSGIPVATQPLDTSIPGGQPADWSFTGAALPDTSDALLASITDSRDQDPLWVTTYATIADAATLDDLRASYGRIQYVRTFALTRDVIDSVVAPLLGFSGDDLLARGLLIGIVVDQAESCGEQPPAVSDCTVSADRPEITISYPNSTVSGLADETAKQGMFFAVPDAAGSPSTASFSVTPGLFDSREWDTSSVWIVPGAVSVQLFVAR